MSGFLVSETRILFLTTHICILTKCIAFSLTVLASLSSQSAAVRKKRPYKDAFDLDNLVVISEDRLSEFDRQWNQHKINLLRSPPSSGKTTFSKRLQLYSEKHKGRVVRRLSTTAVNDTEAMDNANSFDDVWEKVVGESWSNCCACTVPTDILIDQAQNLYGKADFFWRDIKGLLHNPNPNLRVLLISMYSDRLGVMRDDLYIPIDFPSALGLEWLRLKRAEFDQLVESFINFVFDSDDVEFTIPINVRDAIFNFTAGHPHVVRETLHILKDHSRRHLRRTDFKDSDMLFYLLSNEYNSRIQNLRVFDALGNLEMTNDNVEFLRNAFYSVDSNSTFTFNSSDDRAHEAARRFKLSGLITEAHSRCMQFAVPLMRIFLGRKLFTARIFTQSPTQSAVTFNAVSNVNE